MKNTLWILYLFTDSSKSEILKIMEFKFDHEKLSNYNGAKMELKDVPKDKLKNIDYFLNGTGFLNEDDEPDKFTVFNEWMKKEGVVMPKLEYPSYFEDG